ncbi:ABC transporter ATP-binding protein [Paenibacillus thermotolerans]|uniref:ABC transporter ATP-binding protein n=1 Tax=Paenibacillus thermotolerans TaxID=3027807 RepID=UPI0023674AD1|nr:MULTISPECIES: ABC transporter ATP-binding protein [unclassified Paenibacillus]
MTYAIEMKRVTHAYVSDKGAELSVKDIRLAVRPGEFVSLVGPSGCGKTTILSMISGLIMPSEGEVNVLGTPIEKPHPKVGYMLQQDYLFPWKTIRENAAIGLDIRGVRSKENEEYIMVLLREMGLEASAGRYPHQLSGGMRQRAALVRTLAVRPDILLLDEPFSALDYVTKLKLEDLVSETIRSFGMTAVLVTHDISEAIAMSDRVFIMAKNPGTIRREIDIPEHIREAIPFQAREKPGFQNIFHDIWKEFEGGEGDA